MPRAGPADLAKAWASVDRALAGTPWTTRADLPRKLPPDASVGTVKMLVTAIRLAKGLDSAGVQQHDPPLSAVQIEQRFNRLASSASRGSRGPRWTSTDLKTALAQARKERRAGSANPALDQTDGEVAAKVARLEADMRAVKGTLTEVNADYADRLSSLDDTRRNEQGAQRSPSFPNFSSEVDQKRALHGL
ncbi:hypothetical protein JCM9279_000434 [Rhodotorula babjevae]